MKRAGLLIIGVVAVLIVSSLPLRSGGVALQESKLKNIKVLTGMSDTEINKEMQVWTKALGVKCSHCHTLGDFATDENPKKVMARQMVSMVNTLNKDFLKGEKKASCMLCHRGAAVPTEEGSN